MPLHKDKFDMPLQADRFKLMLYQLPPVPSLFYGNAVYPVEKGPGGPSVSFGLIDAINVVLS